jgi:hypothetical protein
MFTASIELARSALDAAPDVMTIIDEGGATSTVIRKLPLARNLRFAGKLLNAEKLLTVLHGFMAACG